eukprot:15365688-Ditylum_brightwellii.AAC.1
MMYKTGQQVYAKIDLNTFGWYNNSITPNMQWILATVTQESGTNQTVKCIVFHSPYNMFPTLTGNWQNSHSLDFVNVKSIGADEAAGI